VYCCYYRHNLRRTVLIDKRLVSNSLSNSNGAHAGSGEIERHFYRANRHRSRAVHRLPRRCELLWSVFQSGTQSGALRGRSVVSGVPLDILDRTYDGRCSRCGLLSLHQSEWKAILFVAIF
jgi:hypothetical protein